MSILQQFRILVHYCLYEFIKLRWTKIRKCCSIDTISRNLHHKYCSIFFLGLLRMSITRRFFFNYLIARFFYRPSVAFAHGKLPEKGRFPSTYLFWLIYFTMKQKSILCPPFSSGPSPFHTATRKLPPLPSHHITKKK